jgi:hypothetical protein
MTFAIDQQASNVCSKQQLLAADIRTVISRWLPKLAARLQSLCKQEILAIANTYICCLYCLLLLRKIEK